MLASKLFQQGASLQSYIYVTDDVTQLTQL